MCTVYQHVDSLFRQLLEAGYPSLALHGGNAHKTNKTKQSKNIQRKNKKQNKPKQQLIALLPLSCFECVVSPFSKVVNEKTMLVSGMDQIDRDFALEDFKSKLRTVLVATSLCARSYLCFFSSVCLLCVLSFFCCSV